MQIISFTDHKVQYIKTVLYVTDKIKGKGKDLLFGSLPLCIYKQYNIMWEVGSLFCGH